MPFDLGRSMVPWWPWPSLQLRPATKQVLPTLPSPSRSNLNCAAWDGFTVHNGIVKDVVLRNLGFAKPVTAISSVIASFEFFLPLTES